MKFDRTGNALPYPGNTVICSIGMETPAHKALVRLQNGLRQAAPADAFAFLPTDSFHMTVYRGVNHLRRLPAEWPEDLPLDLPLDEVTRIFAERLAPLDLPSGFRMRPMSLDSCPTGESQLRLGGETAAVDHSLDDARRKMRNALGHARPGENAYAFHITFSYRLRALSIKEEEELSRAHDSLFLELIDSTPVIETGGPVFCKYDDMLQFHPVLRLFGDSGGKKDMAR